MKLGAEATCVCGRLDAGREHERGTYLAGCGGQGYRSSNGDGDSNCKTSNGDGRCNDDDRLLSS